jgi:hypothetical protein
VDTTKINNAACPVGVFCLPRRCHEVLFSQFTTINIFVV